MTSLGRVLAAALALVLLGACANAGTESDTRPVADVRPLSELAPLKDPKNHEGPSTAVMADRHVKPVASNPKQQLPATVKSHDRGGDRKTIVDDTSRVLALSMSGAIASTVHGLGFGDTLVGRDTSTEIPELQKLPVVTTDGHSINAEAIMRLRPTLIITDGTVGPRDVVEQLRDAGVTVVFVKNESSFDGAAELARETAAVYGAPEVGNTLAAQIESEIAETEDHIKRFIPKRKDERLSMLFLYLRGDSDIYYLFGEESGSSDLIAGLGGIDVAKDRGWTEMRPLTDEAVAAANPDLILVMTGGLKSVGGIDRLLQTKPAIALTKAGEHRRFVDMADADVLSFGPRSAGVLEALARAVYAPRS